MEIPRIEGALLRVAPETVRADPALGLSVGQQVVARVLASGDGTALLDLAGRHLHARTSVALAVGQQVELQVTSLGTEIALRLLGGGGVVSDQQLALATLATAQRPAPTPAPDLGALLRVLELEAGGSAPVDLRARLAQLLGGVPASAETSALAGQLRNLLENSGLLFESRVRAWLEAAPAAESAPGAPLPPTVAADLKVLLGVLARALGSPVPSTPAGAPASPPSAAETPASPSPAGHAGERAPQLSTTPAPLSPAALAPSVAAGDALRAHLQQWVAASQGREALSEGTSLGALKEAVLARQVETAYHWVRDGTLALDLPLVFNGEAVNAHLRFRRGPDPDAEPEPGSAAGGQGMFFDFALEPPGLGPIRAQAHLVGTRLGVRFIVASPEVAALIGAEWSSLVEGLARGGLGLVRTAVDVDPARARLETLPPPSLPRGGSVLDARV